MSGTTAARPVAKPPISAHPAFPAIVALWFGALLGLGSLVVPVTLMERLTGWIGLSNYLSAAQPPLGSTARIIAALCAGFAGAVAGYALSRLVASAQRARRASSRASRPDEGVLPEASPARPISAHEELGDAVFDPEVDAASASPESAIAPQLAVTDDDADRAGSDAQQDSPDCPEESEMLDEPGPVETAPADHDPAEDSAAPREVAIVDLVDRFARALRQHREVMDQSTLATADLRAQEADADAVEEDGNSAFEQPFSLVEGGYASCLSEEDADEDSGEDSDEAYPSLLAMKSPFGLPREPVRIDDFAGGENKDADVRSIETVIRTTGTGPARSTTEDALRDALEKLQRMSGAA